MLRNNESRFAFYAFLLLTAVLLAVVGQWALAGIFGSVVLGAAILTHVVATLFAPRVIHYGPPAADLVMCGLAIVAGLVVGGITFGWWGIAYAVGALAGYLFSKALS